MAEKLNLTEDQKAALFAEWQEKQEAAARIKAEKLNISAFQYGGTILNIDTFEPKPKTDKTTGAPILNSEGQPTFWDASYYVEIAHLGSSRKFVVPLELGKDLQKGLDYLFEGDLSDTDNRIKVKRITQI